MTRINRPNCPQGFKNQQSEDHELYSLVCFDVRPLPKKGRHCIDAAVRIIGIHIISCHFCSATRNRFVVVLLHIIRVNDEISSTTRTQRSFSLSQQPAFDAFGMKTVIAPCIGRPNNFCTDLVVRETNAARARNQTHGSVRQCLGQWTIGICGRWRQGVIRVGFVGKQ